LIYLELSHMSTEFASTIDVREISPRERHPLIFDAFNALQPGQSLQLVNDHDPRPLQAQFESLAKGLFSWSYLEAGPALWRIQIGKLAGTVPAPAAGSCCGGCCGG
jgi:uncharacterized protein (DUF2249 family)